MRGLWKLVFGLALLGCGGELPEAPVGFVNQTQHSDAELWTIWKAAQENLAHEVDLNPLQRSISGAPADIRPGGRTCAQGYAPPTPSGPRARCLLQHPPGRDRP